MELGQSAMMTIMVVAITSLGKREGKEVVAAIKGIEGVSRCRGGRPAAREMTLCAA